MLTNQQQYAKVITEQNIKGNIMAVAAPKVQSLSQAMADLNPAYAASKKVIQKQQAAVPVKYDAQRAGLTAEKGQGFNAINNQATGRGGSFSGIPIDEQATYLSTKYLPGIQQANFQQNAEQLQFQGDIAGLNKEQRLGAIGRRDKQTSDLNSWNSQIQQQQFTSSENAKNRAASAAESAANRAASASNAAASRAASAPREVSPYNAALGIISQVTASGGKINAASFQLARDAYKTANNGNSKGFAEQFWKYVPKADTKTGAWKDYYYG